MIRTESEYKRAKDRLEQDAQTIRAQEDHLRAMGLRSDEITRALEPMISFRDQLREEVEDYESMKRGQLPELHSLESIGRWLIGVRIARGWTQQELADRLGSTPAQVSRDERNEYRGITIERAQRVLSALRIRFGAQIEEPITPDAEFEDA